MKVIAFSKDHGIRDASDPEELTPVLEKLDFTGEYEVVLDLKRCLLDYPGSSALIDKVMQTWELSAEKKQLTILLDYQLKMPTILSWLFLGSQYIEARTMRDINLEQIEEQIVKCMQKVNASLVIKIESIDGQKSEKQYA
jgi:hypothetical protein